MLKEIRIRNFAIIESLDLEFTPGFNIFTGETGAGKSIILDALSIVLGEKADNTFIREGAKRASVEAVFDYGNRGGEIEEILEREDLLPDDGIEEVCLSREMRSEGRSTARINGHGVSLEILREVGALLVDIHGQSEHLSLLKPASHIRLVDQFAGNGDLLKKYRDLYRQYLSTVKSLNSLRDGEAEALRQQDMLSYQLNEINAAELSETEEEKLNRERERMANSERIARLLHQGLAALEGRSEERPGIIDQMDTLDSALDDLTGYDDTLAPLYDAVVTAADQMNEVLDKLNRYKATLGFSARKRNQIEERLSLYYSLKRKYGGTVTAVLAYAEEAGKKLSLITTAGDCIKTLEAEREELLEKLSGIAVMLSEKRTAAAKEISRGVEQELDDLRMPAARFEVLQENIPSADGLSDGKGSRLAFTDSGFDRIEFLIAPNPGEGLKPLAKVASGGETSRLMLALKNTLAQADTIPTMVFDEIDQGIGGRIGALVGEKLWLLSCYHQVICITHLPQLAALYDSHYHVRKQICENRTQTVVTQLKADESLHELASLLGADNAENVKAVEAMLVQADTFKAEHGARKEEKDARKQEGA
ncbi:MAG: DNA repair protein RecN [Anaerolineaceae bacterium]|nr:DNA repair protein RecN [Anaerolineaceae bacterium]